jgi:hypothetical protein
VCGLLPGDVTGARIAPCELPCFLGRERADALMLGHHIRDDDQFPLQNAVDSQAASDRKSAYRVGF